MADEIKIMLQRNITASQRIMFFDTKLRRLVPLKSTLNLSQNYRFLCHKISYNHDKNRDACQELFLTSICIPKFFLCYCLPLHECISRQHEHAGHCIKKGEIPWYNKM